YPGRFVTDGGRYLTLSASSLGDSSVSSVVQASKRSASQPASSIAEFARHLLLGALQVRRNLAFHVELRLFHRDVRPSGGVDGSDTRAGRIGEQSPRALPEATQETRLDGLSLAEFTAPPGVLAL